MSPKSETLFLAGEKGYIPMSINFTPGNMLSSHWEAVEEGASKAGRTASHSSWRIAREVYIADTTEQARKEALEGTIARDFSDYFFRSLSKFDLMKIFKSNPDMPDSDITLEYLVDNIWIVGSPEDVTAKIRALYDQVGGCGVLVAMGHEWNPKDRWINAMELLANEVLPKLSDLE